MQQGNATNVQGVDLSYFQGVVDFPLLAQTKRAAMIRMMYGGSFMDPQAIPNWRGAHAVRMDRGAYQFLVPTVATVEEPVQQATAFWHAIQLAGGVQPADRLVADWEYNPSHLSPDQLLFWLHHWMATITQLHGGPGEIYTNPNFWITAMDNVTAFHQLPLWVADYGVAAPPNFGGWTHWNTWQWSDVGHVQGIRGDVDLDEWDAAPAPVRAPAPPGPAFLVPFGTEDLQNARLLGQELGWQTAWIGDLPTNTGQVCCVGGNPAHFAAVRARVPHAVWHPPLAGPNYWETVVQVARAALARTI